MLVAFKDIGAEAGLPWLLAWNGGLAELAGDTESRFKESVRHLGWVKGRGPHYGEGCRWHLKPQTP